MIVPIREQLDDFDQNSLVFYTRFLRNCKKKKTITWFRNLILLFVRKARYSPNTRSHLSRTGATSMVNGQKGHSSIKVQEYPLSLMFNHFRLRKLFFQNHLQLNVLILLQVSIDFILGMISLKCLSRVLQNISLICIFMCFSTNFCCCKSNLEITREAVGEYIYCSYIHSAIIPWPIDLFLLFINFGEIHISIADIERREILYSALCIGYHTESIARPHFLVANWIIKPITTDVLLL